MCRYRNPTNQHPCLSAPDVMTHRATPSDHTKHADNTRTAGARRARMPRVPTDRLRRHGFRPSTGGVGSGAETHRRRATAMPQPRSGASSGALERPPREAGARVACGHLQPLGAGSGGTERGMATDQPAPPPASCSAAPQQHGRLARSEASRRRRNAHGTQASRRSSFTCGGSRCKLRAAATATVRMS